MNYKKTQDGTKEKEVLSEGRWSDREIATIEDDQFDSQDYAKVLADRAATADTPLTIGIFGHWGSGKTSLMRLIEARLKEACKEKDEQKGDNKDDDQIIQTVWINVWELSNQEEVWHAFLQAIFSEVHRKLKKWQRINLLKLAIQLFSNLLRVVLVITPMVLGLLFIGNSEANSDDVVSLMIASGGTVTTVGILLWILARLKPIIEAAREVVTFDLQEMLKDAPYEAQVTALIELRNQFEEKVTTLVGENGRLVVFIDDLDRCTPDKIPEVLEAIKLFTTTRRCVYVLGLDHNIVRRALKTKYKFETETAATEYLEKIVQIPFHLRPLDEGRIERFVEKYYPDLQEVCPAAPEVFSKGLDPNPRQVKRALNIYRTLLYLADVRVDAWEMDPVEEELVAKIVVIENRFRALYQYLVKDPEFLLKIEARAFKQGEMDDKSETDDKEISSRLIGKPKTKDSEAEPGLIDIAGQEALYNMLRAGTKRFADDDQRDQIDAYIYLIATAEGTAERVRSNRREREVLIGGNPTEIEEQVNTILARAGADEEMQNRIKRSYIGKLLRLLSDYNEYTLAQRLSANTALDLLEGWKQQDFEPEMVHVPGGSFIMGSDPNGDKHASDEEQPQHSVELATYRIGRYPVTNAEYRRFVEDMGYKDEPGWTEYWQDNRWSKPNQPVIGVNWYECVAYCRWLSEKTGKIYRLPSEAEWEKAARGTDGRIYPWGNQWDPMRCNSAEGGKDGTTPVGFYLNGASPYGLLDTAGNVWEWCATNGDKLYPYATEDEWSAEYLRSDEIRVLRGGSWSYGQDSARCTSRLRAFPDDRGSLGFRVVCLI